MINQSDIKLTDVLNGETAAGTQGNSPVIWGRERIPVTSFEVDIKPHSFRVFRIE
ncbi:MAG: hypothetical protein JXB19_00935 [Bacteroidales bacterium]|nr:hypothetical protein [Bacteroidales bacterium]